MIRPHMPTGSAALEHLEKGVGEVVHVQQYMCGYPSVLQLDRPNWQWLMQAAALLGAA